MAGSRDRPSPLATVGRYGWCAQDHADTLDLVVVADVCGSAR